MEWSDLTRSDDTETLPVLPNWITSARGESHENAVFLSGAALAYLHLVLARQEVPQGLLRDRLALQAAEVCMAVSGRPERAADLRDALHLDPTDFGGSSDMGNVSQRVPALHAFIAID
ncbi:DUF1403 family protein, partial [Yoonia sp.]|uniref:DUF1403 family protein n=1 Tax=Yoonia sp. TaxID=2212373 RepID=UPI0039772379